MAETEIDLAALRKAVNAVLDHLVQDLGLEKVPIDDAQDLYWECSGAEKYDTLKKPVVEEAGRLSDDMEFVRLIERGQSADVSYNLIHVAPLLQYLAEKVKR